MTAALGTETLVWGLAYREPDFMRERKDTCVCVLGCSKGAGRLISLLHSEMELASCSWILYSWLGGHSTLSLL